MAESTAGDWSDAVASAADCGRGDQGRPGAKKTSHSGQDGARADSTEDSAACHAVARVVAVVVGSNHSSSADLSDLCLVDSAVAVGLSDASSVDSADCPAASLGVAGSLGSLAAGVDSSADSEGNIVQVVIESKPHSVVQVASIFLAASSAVDCLAVVGPAGFVDCLDLDFLADDSKIANCSAGTVVAGCSAIGLAGSAAHLAGCVESCSDSDCVEVGSVAAWIDSVVAAADCVGSSVAHSAVVAAIEAAVLGRSFG